MTVFSLKYLPFAIGIVGLQPARFMSRRWNKHEGSDHVWCLETTVLEIEISIERTLFIGQDVDTVPHGAPFFCTSGAFHQSNSINSGLDLLSFSRLFIAAPFRFSRRRFRIILPSSDRLFTGRQLFASLSKRKRLTKVIGSSRWVLEAGGVERLGRCVFSDVSGKSERGQPWPNRNARPNIDTVPSDIDNKGYLLDRDSKTTRILPGQFPMLCRRNRPEQCRPRSFGSCFAHRVSERISGRGSSGGTCKHS